MARAITSGTIQLGLVAVPIKFFTACSSEQARFSYITPKGNKVKQQYIDLITQEVVDVKECLKGFEHSKGQYVTFKQEEIKALEAERTNTIELVEFVPFGSVDLIGVEKTYYIGPDKGGDRAYLLLADVMRNKECVAVGRWSARGKEQLVVIRPYRNGLVLHQMYYSNEVRSFDEIEESIAKIDLNDRERALAGSLVDQLTTEGFDSSQYKDEYLHRINAAVQQKLAGEELTIVADSPKANVLDLFAALQASIETAKTTKKAAKPASKSSPKASKPKKKRKAG